MTSPSPDRSNIATRWKSYCTEYDHYFDRHSVTHALYTFSLLFTFFTLFQLFAAPQFSLKRAAIASLFYAAFTTTVAVAVRYSAARKRRTGASRHGDQVI
jgi:hypothetical protein